MKYDAIDINYLLKKKNSSQAKIARQLRVSRCAVYLVVQGLRKTARTRAAISREIGIPVEELWPEYGQAA